MEKKTIEEAAECFAHNNFEMHETNHYQGLQQGFKGGAEWYANNQSEQMYSEEEVEQFIYYVMVGGLLTLKEWKKLKS